MEVHGRHVHIKDPHAVGTMDLSMLTEEQRADVKNRAEFMEKHMGHDSMHAQMALILLISMVGGQVLLFMWKRWRPRAFQRLTLLGMLLVPPLIAAHAGFWRFLVSWSAFVMLTGYVGFLATRNPLDRRTPRLVYAVFVLLYKTTYFVGTFGYITLFLDFASGGRMVMFGAPVAQTGLLILFYALYYGVLGRDIAEMCTDRMASTIGFTQIDGLPKKKLDPNMCGICTESLPPVGSPDETRVVKLECQHHFHEFCIRGWCIVGKKQTCPYCKEKVDLKQMFRNPWEKQDLLYGNFLDVFRYLLVWQPVIMKLVNFYFSVSGLE
ncbi:ring finger protein [Capsaspora owczarzaki ATCC 30864]|uniref:Ring finger protein n=1 Tax=Capsaspora owczarzaki (strain ATCC 30864) TaxID=595528 RepID=A0A0D2UQ30_CAPO3|nr:ring finger protein [Capsaspora owczarzaki ATCC 30864]KJE97096.1 ring finger protein [Capsaspora owczarzaki ATCC 30864]|eukprot:XP_004343440.1 ring finger protein [Capsaspora owczarzaki ATCC 30864]